MLFGGLKDRRENTMNLFLLIVLVAIFYFFLYKPKRRQKEALAFAETVESVKNSEFVESALQIVRFMVHISKMKETIGPFFVAQQNGLLFNVRVRADSWVFEVKRPDDGVRRPDTNEIIKTYQELFLSEMDSILENVAKETGVPMTTRFEDLHISYYPDPEDSFDEWLAFEKRMSIPSQAHVAALKKRVEEMYPAEIKAKRISLHL